MGTTRTHWTHLYQPTGGDFVKPTSNDYAAILASIENAADLGNTRTLANVDAGAWLKTTTTGNGWYLVDEAGNRFALGFDKTGQFDTTTKWALANLLHYYAGPEKPVVYAGNWVIWQPTDAAGNPTGTPQRGQATA